MGFPYYEGGEADVDCQDGRLRQVRGVHHYQVIRAVREGDRAAGWTFHHHPLLAYWNDQFLLQYITCPVEENRPPSQTMLIRSRNGIDWTEPVVLFPPYPIIDAGVYRDENDKVVPPGSYAMMHQRTGFFLSRSRRMLCLGFYGITPNMHSMPNDGKGIGRVVRELLADGSLGPIYFIRYNRHAGWDETNTSYPHYKMSEEEGFIEACEELLQDRLATLAWWEEDRSQDGMYALTNIKAPVYYKLPHGKVVVFGKWSQVAISDNNGFSWEGPQTASSIVMAGSKIWAQRLKNGKYMIVYNPNPSNEKRWPLAMAQSDDGLAFKELHLLCGEVPKRRYAGRHKYRGMNYISGMTEGIEEVPGSDIWLTFSMNKEDIWVSRIPLSLDTEEFEPLCETFGGRSAHSDLSDWQLYRPLWSELLVVPFPDDCDPSLKLSNADPFDQAVAERTFPKCAKARISLGLLAAQATHGQLHILVSSGQGDVLCRLLLNPDGRLTLHHANGFTELMTYQSDRWYDLVILLDLDNGVYGVEIADGASVYGLPCLTRANYAERISFRVGGDSQGKRSVDDGADVPGDSKVQACTYYVNFVKVMPLNDNPVAVL